MSGSLCTSRNSLLRVNGSERISESSNLAICGVIPVPKLYHLRCFLSQAKRGQSVGEGPKGHEGSPGLRWVYLHSDNHCEGQTDDLCTLEL